MSRIKLFRTPTGNNSTSPPSDVSSAPSILSVHTAHSAKQPKLPRKFRKPFHSFPIVGKMDHLYHKTIQYFGFQMVSGNVSVPDAGFICGEFLLGAGMVIIQPSTGKVVVCYDTQAKYYFLPKGRKDTDEPIEQTAVREAAEESGYNTVEHFPLLNYTRQPSPPNRPRANRGPNIEPVYLQLHALHPKFNHEDIMTRDGGEYLTFWFVGQIAADATWTAGTGMADEQNYTSELYTFDKAAKLLENTVQLEVLVAVHKVYQNHCRCMEELHERG